jgi:hypothetical protein
VNEEAAGVEPKDDESWPAVPERSLSSEVLASAQMKGRVDRTLWTIGTIGRTFAFTGVLLTAQAWGVWGAARVELDNGVDLGLVVAAVTGLVAALWGGADGVRESSLRSVIARWLAVGVLAGLAAAFGNQIPGQASHSSNLAFDIGTDVLFGLGIASCPSMLAGVVTNLELRPRLTRELSDCRDNR